MIVRKCPNCKKEFYFNCTEDEWGFAYDNKLTCSYKCMRSMENSDRMKVRKNYIKGNGPNLYRQRLRGKSYEAIARTGTAKSVGIETPEDARRYIMNWSRHHIQEADAIRSVIEAEAGKIKRTDIAAETGVDVGKVYRVGKSIGIEGQKVGRHIMYTQADADRLIRELRRETARSVLAEDAPSVTNSVTLTACCTARGRLTERPDARGSARSRRPTAR